MKRYSMRTPGELAGKLLKAGGRRVMGTITHVLTQEPVAALTFDDGPHPEFTPRLLNILEKYQAQATFFMIGQMAHQQPAMVRQIVQAGHTIGNHSWDHPSFPLITSHQRRSQLRACEQAVTPYGQKLFRPPYGHQNVASRLDLLRLGYQVVTWNVVAYDWLDHDAAWINHRLTSQIKPGSIILLHDALYHALKPEYINREAMLEAVDLLLGQLSGSFRFITVPQLLQCGRPRLQNWYKHGDLNWLNQLDGPNAVGRRYVRQDGI
ncbi:MAG: polysaccharide deacetylase family protein [Anaerolineae bacterium]|nr:polysaccharide deacetylase family protein [Anaerolineae bacterium]